MAIWSAALCGLLLPSISVPASEVPEPLLWDDECSARTEACALHALQTRAKEPRQADEIFEEIARAFTSDDGLLVRVIAEASEISSKSWPAVSASALRWDLPPALYVYRRRLAVMGLILRPGRVKVKCAYPFDANSKVRQNDEGQREKCGKTNPVWGSKEVVEMSGRCNFESAQDYAKAFFNKPQDQRMLKSSGYWNLDSGTCHFASVAQAVDAQRALLQLSGHLPQGTTETEWLRNASRVGFGLTAFNEIVAAPFDSKDVLAIFWSHSGPFRDPAASDPTACELSDYFRTTQDPRPVVEIAGVILQRPFQGCDVTFDSGGAVSGYFAMNPNCLRQFLEDWNTSMLSGGYAPARVFRVLSSSKFLAIPGCWSLAGGPTHKDAFPP